MNSLDQRFSCQIIRAYSPNSRGLRARWLFAG